STDPIRYFNHPTMRLKLLFVIVGLVFNYALHNRVAAGDYSPAAGRLVAVLSLAGWTTTVFGGIFYAFTLAPLLSHWQRSAGRSRTSESSRRFVNRCTCIRCSSRPTSPASRCSAG